MYPFGTNAHRTGGGAPLPGAGSTNPGALPGQLRTTATGEPLPIRPALRAQGRLLLFSDSPESLTTPGVLYRDGPFGWPLRVFLHHHNAGSQPLAIYICVKNASAHPTAVTARSSGAGISPYPIQAGHEALEQYLRHRGSLRVNLPPGRWARWGVSQLHPGQVFSGIYEFNPERPLWVTVLAAAPGDDPDPISAPALPRDGQHRRGTWLRGDRRGVIEYRVSQGEAAVQLANEPRPVGAVSSWQYPLPGEYQLGVDRLSGRTEFLLGNYGVLYHLDLRLRNDAEGARRVRLGLQPRGGDWWGAVAVEGRVMGPTAPVAAWKTWWFWELDLPSGRQQRLRLRWMPPGGSFLPVRLCLGSRLLPSRAP